MRRKEVWLELAEDPIVGSASTMGMDELVDKTRQGADQTTIMTKTKHSMKPNTLPNSIFLQDLTNYCPKMAGYKFSITQRQKPNILHISS
ncbi:conserved hypothetical protein [Ricinus communis]|uniref:Uncharacterized protein n=1 Tax=Ricinus communis TaxID=3988 RepID=B9S4P4_RICCO|nr:conserved hypothetical protein [Ricinus communis]